MKIFISGSRTGYKFNNFELMAKWLKEKGHEVLVGDCVGVDTQVQAVCKAHKVPCRVYHIGAKPRNNLGFDTVRCLGTKYEDKDIVMAQECDVAIVIWNGRSKGTKGNIDRVRELHKQVIVR